MLHAAQSSLMLDAYCLMACIPVYLHLCIPASLHPCIPASLHPCTLMTHSLALWLCIVVQYGAFISEVTQFCGGYVRIDKLKADCYNGLEAKVPWPWPQGRLL